MNIRWQFTKVSAPYWGDRPVVLVGGGPSIKGFDLSPLRECAYVVAVKGAIFDCPWATLGFGLDLVELARWWRQFFAVQFPVYWAVPDKWNDKGKLKAGSLLFLRRTIKSHLSDDPFVINGGGTSGFGALNLAYLKRARRIVLFGFDYGPTNGQWHANDQYYNPGHVYNLHEWERWAQAFDDTKEQLRQTGTEVFNASPASRIEAFPKMTVEEGIELCRQ